MTDPARIGLFILEVKDKNMDTIYHLTKQGLAKLEKEYKDLLRLKVEKTTGDDVPAILHSEEANPEYLSLQEDLMLLESRVGELEKVLHNAEIIELPEKTKRDQIQLGATILVEVDDGKIDEFQIIGTLEADPFLGKISDESPVGRALLGKKIGERVIISSPRKTIYTVKEITY